MKNKSPAFQFYPSDYISSLRVSVLTLQEQGAYIRLLCYCWMHGSIPSDPIEMSYLLGREGTPVLATSVAHLFTQDPNSDDRLIHDRLIAELEKQSVWRENKSKAGKASAAMRAKPQSVATPVKQEAQQTPQQNPTLQSSVFSLHNKDTGGAVAPGAVVPDQTEPSEPADKPEVPNQKAPQTPVPVKNRPVMPTMAIWQAESNNKHPDWPVNDVQAAWEYYEKIGWRTKSGPIVKWEMCVNTCYRNWKQRQSAPGYFPRSPFAQPAQPIRIPDNLRPEYIAIHGSVIP